VPPAQEADGTRYRVADRVRNEFWRLAYRDGSYKDDQYRFGLTRGDGGEKPTPSLLLQNFAQLLLFRAP
jgi:hypothetical protein